jgi:hypothetical protein
MLWRRPEIRVAWSNTVQCLVPELVFWQTNSRRAKGSTLREGREANVSEQFLLTQKRPVCQRLDLLLEIDQLLLDVHGLDQGSCPLRAR